MCIVHLGADGTLSRHAGFILLAARRRQRGSVLLRTSVCFGVLRRASAASSAVTSPGAKLCPKHVHLQRSKSAVLAVWSNGLCLNPSPKWSHPWLRLLLAVPQTHTSAQGDAYPNMRPLMAHLTPETLEPGEGQMAAAGRGLLGELVPVRRRMRTGSIAGEGGVSRRR